MKNNFKIISVLFIIFCMVLGCTSVFAEDKIAETNVTWRQEADVLYIDGTGDMIIDFEYITEIPWYPIRDQISKIVVGEGLTSIYDSAFADFRLVKEVQLPNSLRVIGPAAFITCSSLETLVLPYKITKIQSGAFVNCEALTVITIPGSITEIASDTFYNCPEIDIVGVRDTYANKFADEHNIPFFSGIRPSEEILVRINGEYADFDQPPVIINDRTMVPMRKIFEAMGIEVHWDADTRTVSAVRDNISIKMVVDTNIIYQTIDGTEKEITIDVPAQIVGDRTMVPARAIAESFLASVNWDAPTRTVIVQD